MRIDEVTKMCHLLICTCAGAIDKGSFYFQIIPKIKCILVYLLRVTISRLYESKSSKTKLTTCITLVVIRSTMSMLAFGPYPNFKNAILLYNNKDIWKLNQYHITNNLAKLRNRKNKHTIHFFQVESPPFTSCFGKSLIWTLPPWNKKTPTPSKVFRESKSPLII